ncbi:cation diffusion facilitator family transporter [Caldinitratiruptor microaerophilus]|uniref:Cation transporter n=1 Tax=Caldinitratiruptor microaerophilus TaxID=671077 RepID=A0AA35G617_9FIRM|nr:cation diffusion facilitator family transporter [Caldinitratiruptor microaerophilus]BDG60541.1 cation transporter [Caldinitratiruptor microaerophilus]
MQHTERPQGDVKRILWGILALNLAVALAKVLYGWASRSAAMVADGFHSLSDGTSNVIGLVGITLAQKPIDRTHPYGHKKFETFTTIGIAALLLFVAFEVVTGVVDRIRHPVAPSVTAWSFAVMLATMAVNAGVYLYESRAGRRLGSDFLVADSLHTRSDILVSLSVLAGLAGVRLGLPWLDWAVALVIAGLIAWSAWEIIRDGANVLCDAAVFDPAFIDPVVRSIPGVREVHQIRSRGRHDSAYVDLHVLVDPHLPVVKAHDLAHRIEEALKGRLPAVVDVLVHVEPDLPGMELPEEPRIEPVTAPAHEHADR